MTNMCKTPVITGKGHTCEEADYWLGKPWICGSWMMASCSPRMEQKRQFTFLWGTNEHMHFSTIVGVQYCSPPINSQGLLFTGLH